MTDPNQAVIDEFRANEGRAGGFFEGKSLALVHHKGAKSGTERVNPLAAQPLEDGSLAIFASKGGAPTHPDWYYNLLAHPETMVEFGTETFPVRARVAEGEERRRIYEEQKRVWPTFAEYEEQTKGIREIPVIVLERV
jgi:deazaflavin-dependent oxidoreductase (nitroreductase family)